MNDIFAKIRDLPRRERNGRHQRPSRVQNGIGYIYVVERIDGHLIKIGYSGSPAARVKDLMREFGMMLFLRWYGACAASEAGKIERLFHKTHRKELYNAHGEWYKLSAEAAAVSLLELAKSCGVVLSSNNFAQEIHERDRELERSVIGRAGSVSGYELVTKNKN